MPDDTLIIPCCGSLTLNGIPSYLVCLPTGKRLVQYALDGINLNNFHHLIFIVPSRHNKEWNAEFIIRSCVNHNNISVVELDIIPSGPALTVLEALRKEKVEGSITIKDADNYLKFEIPVFKNFIVGIDVYSYNGEIRELKNKSFIIANEQSILIDIVEKRICSSVVSLGAYSFADARDYIFACERLLDPICNLDKIYVSQVMAYLMGYRGTVFNLVTADDYVNWGNAADLKSLILNKI